MKTGQKVLVTTEFRGVFIGTIEDASDAPNSITLTNAFNVIYWPAEVGGFLGLANGNLEGCRLGHTVKRVTLYTITSITEAK